MVNIRMRPTKHCNISIGKAKASTFTLCMKVVYYYQNNSILKDYCIHSYINNKKVTDCIKHLAQWVRNQSAASMRVLETERAVCPQFSGSAHAQILTREIGRDIKKTIKLSVWESHSFVCHTLRKHTWCSPRKIARHRERKTFRERRGWWCSRNLGQRRHGQKIAVDTGSSSGGHHHHHNTNRGHHNTTATATPRGQQLDLGKITPRLHSTADPSQAAHKANLSLKSTSGVHNYLLSSTCISQLIKSWNFRDIQRYKTTSKDYNLYMWRNFSVSSIKNLICSHASHGENDKRKFIYIFFLKRESAMDEKESI
jgi:hypothetical protein